MLYNYLIKEYKDLAALSEKERSIMVHVNCCEKIVFGSNSVYKLGLDKNALKMAKGFGGGMNVESSCGVVTGGVMVLSNMFFDSENYRTIIKEFIETFTKDFGTIDCDILKELYRTEEEGCNNIIIKGAKVLDDIIEIYRGELNEKK